MNLARKLPFVKIMLSLYNTRTKQKEAFKPLSGKNVGLYTCGPTVYNFAHIGNLRAFVFEDILRRALRSAGYSVNHVMNITDVGHLTDDADQGEDKMEKGSKREGKTAWEIAEFYTEAFLADMKDLNLLEPHVICKATDHIPEQIAMVEKLMENGHTYRTKDGIYFDTTTIDDYGKLAELEKQDLQAGARVDMGDKKNPHDFALWKFTREGETRQMEWDAFDALGFPGWHIECSAMATKYLGEQFDIHCGGIDLKSVHHINEIAQAECATHKKPWVNVWMHNEFITLAAGEKMSKSAGNFVTLRTITERGIDPLAYRFFLLQAHYRKQLAFSWEALEAAAAGLKNLRKQVAAIPEHAAEDPQILQAFMAAVQDDLNTPEALAVLWKALKDKTISREMVTALDKILGLELMRSEIVEIPSEVEVLLDERKTARENKDFATSDRIRDEIASHGFVVEDGPDGQRVSKA